MTDLLQVFSSLVFSIQLIFQYDDTTPMRESLDTICYGTLTIADVHKRPNLNSENMFSCFEMFSDKWPQIFNV